MGIDEFAGRLWSYVGGSSKVHHCSMRVGNSKPVRRRQSTVSSGYTLVAVIFQRTHVIMDGCATLRSGGDVHPDRCAVQ